MATTCVCVCVCVYYYLFQMKDLYDAATCLSYYVLSKFSFALCTAELLRVKCLRLVRIVPQPQNLRNEAHKMYHLRLVLQNDEYHRSYQQAQQ